MQESDDVTDVDPVRSLELLGYWRSAFDLNWPDVHNFIDNDWDHRERRDVIAYLRHGTVARTFWGASECRICGEENGSIELTDGVFLWPEGLTHYVELHGVRLPTRFAEHVMAHRARPFSIEVDERWWRGLRSSSAPA